MAGRAFNGELNPKVGVVPVERGRRDVRAAILMEQRHIAVGKRVVRIDLLEGVTLDAVDRVGLGADLVKALDVIANRHTQIDPVKVDSNLELVGTVVKLAVVVGVYIGVGTERVRLAGHLKNGRIVINELHASDAQRAFVRAISLIEGALREGNVAVGIIVHAVRIVFVRVGFGVFGRNVIDREPHLVVRGVIIVESILGVLVLLGRLKDDGVATKCCALERAAELELATVEETEIGNHSLVFDLVIRKLVDRFLALLLAGALLGERLGRLKDEERTCGVLGDAVGRVDVHG